MRSDDGLVFVRVVETLDIVEVRDVQCRDVVAERQGKVGELAVVREIRVDGDGFLGLVT